MEQQYVLKLYKVYINDDPELTFTYFTTMSNLGNNCFCTPRYQMSVYRTIDPLVQVIPIITLYIVKYANIWHDCYALATTKHAYSIAFNSQNI